MRSGSGGIASAFIDSRAPIKGGLFVPIVAARDGHDFIGDAIRGGATAVLCGPERAVPVGDVTVVDVDDTLEGLTSLARARRKQLKGPVVSISGSNGKTTTRAMVEAVLRTAFKWVLCTQGNLNNHLGVPLTLLGRPHDPTATVIEMGMNAPGENDHLGSIVRPTVHVVTSIALEHLEFMKTIEAIAAAEAEPFAHVQHRGAVVVPSDEPLLTPHLPEMVSVLRCGPNEGDDVRIVKVETEKRTVATLQPRGQDPVDVRLQTFGGHNARNAAAAMAVGVHLGLPMDAMVAALEGMEPVGDRGRVLELGDHIVIADCYNSNPGSATAALRALVALERPGPLVAVLGDMLELGPQAMGLHADIGRLAADLGVDILVGIGPLSGATVQAATGIQSKHFGRDDMDAAARWLQGRLGDKPGAILVKASRGVKLERFLTALGAR